MNPYLPTLSTDTVLILLCGTAPAAMAHDPARIVNRKAAILAAAHKKAQKRVVADTLDESQMRNAGLSSHLTKPVRQNELYRIEHAEQAEPVAVSVLTANALEDDREHCLEAGMNACLSKPFSEAQLMQSLLDGAMRNDFEAEATGEAA